MRETIRDLIIQVRTMSRAAKIAQLFLYRKPETYLLLYLQHGDEADFLRPPLSAAWQARLSLFDREIGEIATRVQEKGASFMLVWVPPRAQALLLRWKHPPPGVDATLLGRELGAIARRHGVDYIDLTETIGARTDVASLYYALDSHPNGAASAVMADALVAALRTRDDIPANCRAQIEASQ